jgi:AcrR family transcriptional regulator
MAKPGVPSRVDPRASRSAETRRRLVEAAIETLKSDGFYGASARVVAGRAELNQALIFYHFGSVANLLLTALDAVSDARWEHYSRMVEAVGSPTELVDAASEIFRADIDAGYITVLAEMMAGASTSPDLGPAVATRIDAWRGFAHTAIENALVGSGLGPLVPVADVAYGVVALYLGLEMLSHLDGNREPALKLFAHAREMAQLLQSLTRTAGK